MGVVSLHLLATDSPAGALLNGSRLPCETAGPTSMFLMLMLFPVVFFLSSSTEPEVLPQPPAGKVVSAVPGSQLAVLLHHQPRLEPGAAEHARRQAAR